MKISWLLFACCLIAASCTNKTSSSAETNTETGDTTSAPVDAASTPTKTYANERFRDVMVVKTGEHTWRASGKAQIFEATFGWIVEDGHDEIVRGFHQTDAGAPDWGNFDFNVTVPVNENVYTLHLVLFETSAEDGSRQHELAIPLP